MSPRRPKLQDGCNSAPLRIPLVVKGITAASSSFLPFSTQLDGVYAWQKTTKVLRIDASRPPQENESEGPPPVLIGDAECEQ